MALLTQREGKGHLDTFHTTQNKVHKSHPSKTWLQFTNLKVRTLSFTWHTKAFGNGGHVLCSNQETDPQKLSDEFVSNSCRPEFLLVGLKSLRRHRAYSEPPTNIQAKVQEHKARQLGWPNGTRFTDLRLVTRNEAIAILGT